MSSYPAPQLQNVAKSPHLDDSQTVVGNSMISLVHRLASLGIGAVMIMFVPRYLGDEGLGQLAFATSVALLFVTALGMGVGQFLIKEIARNRDQVSYYLKASIGLRLLTSLVAFGIIFVVAVLISPSGDTRWLMPIAAGTVIAGSFTGLMIAVPLGLENMVWPAVAAIAQKLVIVVAGILVLVWGLGVTAYATVLLAAAIVGLVLSAAYVGSRFPLGVSFSGKRLGALIRGGAPFLAAGVVLDVYSQTDMVMLRFFTSDAVVGWYSAAYRLLGVFQMLPVALTAALLPTLARVHIADTEAVVVMAKKSISVGALVVIPLAVSVTLLSGAIFDLLPYPDSFQNSVPLLMIMAWTIPVTAFLIILGTIAAALDRQKAWAWALLATLILNVFLNAVAIPHFDRAYENGAIGAALASVVCEVLYACDRGEADAQGCSSVA